MTDLFGPPIITGIVFYFTYKVFDLFVRKNERRAILEKLGVVQNVNLDALSMINSQFSSMPKASFTGLRIGCLLAGIGLGLLVGLLISMMIRTSGLHLEHWDLRELNGIAYPASAMLFGGAGLLISYLIERKVTKKD